MVAANCDEVIVTKAQRGDVVLAQTDAGSSVGIVDFDGRHAVFSDLKGLSRLLISECTRAWRVG